jgi:hypothetical protein
MHPEPPGGAPNHFAHLAKSSDAQILSQHILPDLDGRLLHGSLAFYGVAAVEDDVEQGVVLLRTEAV